MSGSTQGETNDATPARNAAISETWLTWVSNTRGSARRGEERLDRGLPDPGIGVAHELLHDPPLAVEHERGGDAHDSPVRPGHILVPDQHRVVDLVLVGERAHFA